MKIRTYGLTAALLIASATASAAQVPDSVLAISRSGASLFRVNVDGGAAFRGTFTGASGTGLAVTGAGTRMLWYPQKAAFRAGGVNGTQWDDANIGNYSVAIGQDVRALGDNSVAMGLRSAALQVSALAIGEDNTASGAASVALGYHAHTNARQGAFVFSDRSSVDTLRAGVNHSANWRTSGGFRIFTSSNLTTGVTIQSGATTSNWGHANAVISTSTGAVLTTGGVWENASDVNRKHLFLNVSGEDVLDRLRSIPIRSWGYRSEANSVRHLGPTAQDFHHAFGLGTSELSIGTVDADGVALAGVQALDRRTIDQAAEIAKLREENRALRERLDRLEARMSGGNP